MAGKKKNGKGPISDILSSFGLGKKEKAQLKAKNGKGFMDVLKTVGNFAKDHLLPIVKDVGISLVKKRLGLGKKRTVGGAHYKKVIKM